jgi:signal-transduction protein with cAMP-binding, CBS, and nucleotidyltransferase domain
MWGTRPHLVTETCRFLALAQFRPDENSGEIALVKLMHEGLSNISIYEGVPMSVGEICNRETVIVEKSASILETARLMRSHHVGSIVVMESGSESARPAGIITDRDLVVEVLAANLDIERVTVGDVMSFELMTARESDGIWDTIHRMRTKGVRRVPVVDAQDALAGILSMDDLLARLVKREQKSERDTRTVP